MRIYEEHILRKLFRTDIPGKRGRPKIRWKDAIQPDLEKYWIESERSEVMDRATWSRKIISHTGDPISSRPT